MVKLETVKPPKKPNATPFVFGSPYRRVYQDSTGKYYYWWYGNIVYLK